MTGYLSLQADGCGHGRGTAGNDEARHLFNCTPIESTLCRKARMSNRASISTNLCVQNYSFICYLIKDSN